MSVRITCIVKVGGVQNPYEAIQKYGWIVESSGEHGLTPRLEMVNFIEKGGKAYVKDQKGNVAFCEVFESVNGTKYLKTLPNANCEDNLLSLPRCS